MLLSFDDSEYMDQLEIYKSIINCYIKVKDRILAEIYLGKLKEFMQKQNICLSKYIDFVFTINKIIKYFLIYIPI